MSSSNHQQNGADSHGMASNPPSPKKAPKVTIPAVGIQSVEHPCIVKDADKGIASLGGELVVDRFLHYVHPTRRTTENGFEPIKHVHKTIGATPRPDDHMAKRIMSRQTNTNNVLLKVTVPKRTGRKRKKGTTGPFLTEEEIQRQQTEQSQAVKEKGTTDPFSQFLTEEERQQQQTKHSQATKESANDTTKLSQSESARLFRSMKDNPENYTISGEGVINETHRFRFLPDPVVNHNTTPLLNHISGTLMSHNPSNVMRFTEMFKRDKDDEELGCIMPPPDFFQTPMPHTYSYNPNPFTQFIDNPATGKIQAVNTNTHFRTMIHKLEYDSTIIPDSPHPYLQPESTLRPNTRNLIKRIREYLEVCPIATRRKIMNNIPHGGTSQDEYRRAFAYCGYFFHTGPWRDALVAFNVDPRTDPKWRWYQTLVFQIYGEKNEQRQLDGGIWKSWAEGRGAPFVDSHLLVRSPANNVDSIHIQAKDGEEAVEGKEGQQNASTSHIFYGKPPFILTTRIYHVLDLHDPQLLRILKRPNLPLHSSPNIVDGYFHHGTMAKVKVIMRDKISLMKQGDPVVDSEYEPFIDAFPDIYEWGPEGDYVMYGLNLDEGETYSERQKWMRMNMKGMAKLNAKKTLEREGKMDKATKNVGKGQQRAAEGEDMDVDVDVGGAVGGDDVMESIEVDGEGEDEDEQQAWYKRDENDGDDSEADWLEKSVEREYGDEDDDSEDEDEEDDGDATRRSGSDPMDETSMLKPRPSNAGAC